jgi:hypothetical protein
MSQFVLDLSRPACERPPFEPTESDVARLTSLSWDEMSAMRLVLAGPAETEGWPAATERLLIRFAVVLHWVRNMRGALQNMRPEDAVLSAAVSPGDAPGRLTGLVCDTWCDGHRDVFDGLDAGALRAAWRLTRAGCDARFIVSLTGSTPTACVTELCAGVKFAYVPPALAYLTLRGRDLPNPWEYTKESVERLNRHPELHAAHVELREQRMKEREQRKQEQEQEQERIAADGLLQLAARARTLRK